MICGILCHIYYVYVKCYNSQFAKLKQKRKHDTLVGSSPGWRLIYLEAVGYPKSETTVISLNCFKGLLVKSSSNSNNMRGVFNNTCPLSPRATTAASYFIGRFSFIGALNSDFLGRAQNGAHSTKPQII